MRPFRLIHMSDLHFGTEVDPVVDAVVKSVRALEPQLIVVTGDITQRARRNQFLAARSFLDKLAPIPIISTPGNHDIPLFNLWVRLLNPYRGYLRHFQGSLSGLFVQDGVEVLSLNSTHYLRHVQGELPLKDLEKGLSQFQDKLRIVAFHHPMDCIQDIDIENLLKNRDDAIKLFSQYKVDLVVGGHIHDPVTRTTMLRYPQVDKPFVLSVAGTTVSHRVRKKAPNSFNVYDFDREGSMHLHFRRFEFTGNGFESKTQQTFTRSGQHVWA